MEETESKKWQSGVPGHNIYLTIRPVALVGYGSIAHEAKPNGLLTRGPWGQRVIVLVSLN